MRLSLFLSFVFITLSTHSLKAQTSVERYWAYTKYHIQKNGSQTLSYDTAKIEIKRNGDGTGTISIIPTRANSIGYSTPFWAEQKCGDPGCKECITCFFIRQTQFAAIAQIQLQDEVAGLYITVILNDGTQEKYGILKKTTTFSK